MNSRKKILILGVGNAQTDFISFCKSKEFEVHACSYKHEGRGILEADYFNLINITDIQAVKNYCIEHDIDFIYSTGSDLAMPTLTKVAEELGLPTLANHFSAKKCNNKQYLRQLINGKPFSVTFSILNNREEVETINWSIFPAIVKPLDSQGQRGIMKVYSKQELAKAFDNASPHASNGCVIVEEFIEGLEISVNGFLVNGENKLTFITLRNSFIEFPGGNIQSHDLPFSGNLDHDKLKQLIEETCQLLTLKNGPVYFQIIVEPNCNPKIIEVAPRLDGCHLWRMIYQTRGINLFDIIIKQLSGERITDLDFVPSKAIEKATLHFFTEKPNIPFKKQNFIVSNPNYQEFYYHENELVNKMNGYAEKVGYYINFL